MSQDTEPGRQTFEGTSGEWPGGPCKDSETGVDMLFSKDDLTELETYRDQEIDTLVEAGFIDERDRWTEELRRCVEFQHSEMILTVYTGVEYPIRSLQFEVKNISLPRLTVDNMRVALRVICKQDNEWERYTSWCRREVDAFDVSSTLRILDLCQTTAFHLNQYRRSTGKLLQLSDYHMSLERRRILENWYGHHGLLDYTFVKSIDYDDDSAMKAAIMRGFDPFNPHGRKSIEDKTEERALKIDEVRTEQDLVESAFGVDATSINGHETVDTILGRTPSDIAEAIPKIFRVLHIENIVRSDCIRRFWNAQARIRRELAQLSLSALRQCVGHERRSSLGRRGYNQDTLIDILIEPEITFHGTEEHHVSSIVRYGFLKPETDENVRCGSTYGLGIYSSPDPLFALRYSPIRGQSRTAADDFGGLKLIVCALIPGRPALALRDDGLQQDASPLPGAHCHVGNHGLEFVAFDSAQILPCYVVHLDLGRDACHYLTQLDPPDQWLRSSEARRRTLWAKREDSRLTGNEAPGDRRRIREALMARVTKNLPYGYGAATGHKFQILEIGEVSDDEEDYGLYQEDRLEEWHLEGNSSFWQDDLQVLDFDLEGTLPSEESEPAVRERALDEAKLGGEEGVQQQESEACATKLSGSTKFDKFYDVRIASNRKTLKTLDQIASIGERKI